MRVAIHPADVAALVLGVEVIGIGRIGKHPETVAAVHVFPLRVGDSAGILRFAHPRTVVLQSAVDAIRIGVVHADVIELRDRQVIALPPFAAAVVGIPHAAVVAGEDGLRIGRIDPDVVHVAMRALKSADHRETLARVFAHDERAVGFEDAIRILRIDNQVREIERPPDHPVALVALVPGRAAIIGNEERAVGGFDKSVNALARSTARSQPRCRPYGFFGKPLLFSGVISVQVVPPSAERNSPLAEGASGPSPPERNVQPLRRKSHRAREHHVGIRRIDRDRRAAGGKIGAFQNQIPSLAAIGRLVETAIGRIAP